MSPGPRLLPLSLDLFNAVSPRIFLKMYMTGTQVKAGEKVSLNRNATPGRAWSATVSPNENLKNPQPYWKILIPATFVRLPEF